METGSTVTPMAEIPDNTAKTNTTILLDLIRSFGSNIFFSIELDKVRLAAVKALLHVVAQALDTR
jgi:hypothetical protein